MKRLILATLFAAAAPAAFAQAPAAPASTGTADPIPAHTCGTIPEYPGRLGSDSQKRSFDKAYKAYDKCIRAYIEDRVASMKANEAMVNKVVDETNVVVNKMRADSGEDTSGNSGSAKSAVPGKKQGGY